MAGIHSFTQDLTAGPLSTFFEFPEDTRLNQIMINFSVDITEEVTITLDSQFGAAFDTVLDREELESQPSYEYIPHRQPVIARGDRVLIECTNANLTGILSGTIQTGVRNP